MSLGTHLLFLSFVGLAVFCQNLTGFAFGLILLSMVGTFQLMPVADAANISSILTIVNAWTYSRHHRVRPDWGMLQPMLVSSVLGVVAGVMLLGWLSTNSVNTLRLLLGMAIVVCAGLLLAQGKPRATPSGVPALWSFGVFSGLLGGLFSTSGPPMVYHLYRQPLDRELVKRCLLLMFAGNAALRLVLVVASGHFALVALYLAVEAIPVVYIVSWVQARFPPPLPRRFVEWAVCGLLILAGTSLVAASLK